VFDEKAFIPERKQASGFPKQSQCGGLEGGPTAAMTAGAACFFPACYPSPTENGDDEE
jgi:hypothetical protein